MPSASWIGVAIACGGNVLISLGLNSQKLAHQRLEAASNPPSSNTTPSPSNQNLEHQPDSSSNPSSVRRRHSRQYSSNPSSPIWSPSKLGPLPLIRDPRYEGTLEEAELVPVGAEPESGYFGPQEVLLEDTDPSLPPPHVENGHPVSTIVETAEEDETSPIDKDGQPQGGDDKEVYLKSRLWWAGLALCAVGEAGNFLSYGFAPASVVAPLGTVALVANCFISPIMLGEHITWRDLLGVLLAIIGAITVVISAKDSNPTMDPKSLLIAISQPVFIAYSIINLVLIAFLLAVTHSKRFGNRWIGVDIGICALFGGFTVLSTKALSSLLSRMFIKIFRYKITWVLLAVLVSTSVLQIRYLNRALMAFEGKQVIPTQFVFFSISAIVGSAVLYQEFRDVTFSRMLNFLFGVSTTFLGVFLLTAGQGDRDDQNRQEEESGRPDSGRTHLLALPESAPLLPTTSRSSINNNPYLAVPSKPIRLRKRSSTTSLAGPGLASGGFLLMATTPPAHPHGTFPGLSRSVGARSRSGSRSGSRKQDVEAGSQPRS